MSFTTDPLRLLLAAGLLLAYAAICLLCAWRYKRKVPANKAHAARLPADAQVVPQAGSNSALAESTHWLVAFASQTGTGEEVARQTAATLSLAGLSCSVCSLSELNADSLRSAGRILFIASTYGEGDPPDDAATFAARLMVTALPLPQLHYAVLALGDSDYAQFCGFGRMLDGWLQQQGAQALFARIEVDRNDAAALLNWRHQLSHLVGTDDAPDWGGPAFADWRLAQRQMLNAGSAGEAVYHLELEPANGMLPDWQAGDLVQVVAPAEPDRPREYSIASIPHDGRIHLLVRLQRHADGTDGVASGWLTHQAALGASISMRLREHRRFRLEDNAQRPLVLIGNGTGMAGLRAHLKQRARNHQVQNWLLFGERNAASDFYYRQEIEAWQASGVLQRLNMVFSRDQPSRRYVQHALLDAAHVLHAWVDQGAAIYVCGSLKGMAGDVDSTLADVLGRDQLDQLSDAGRYRRDVY